MSSFYVCLKIIINIGSESIYCNRWYRVYSMMLFVMITGGATGRGAGVTAPSNHGKFSFFFGCRLLRATSAYVVFPIVTTSVIEYKILIKPPSTVPYLYLLRTGMQRRSITKQLSYIIFTNQIRIRLIQCKYYSFLSRCFDNKFLIFAVSKTIHIFLY